MSRRIVTRALVAIFLLPLLFLASCTANDNMFNLAITNDTSQAVRVGDCEGSCQAFAYTLDLKPGQTANGGFNPNGYFTPMKVLSGSRRTLGCLPFKFSKTPPANANVDVSQKVPCGDSLGAKSVHGRDWPYSNL